MRERTTAADLSPQICSVFERLFAWEIRQVSVAVFEAEERDLLVNEKQLKWAGKMGDDSDPGHA